MKSKNNILIITSYFPPETGAAANRIFALAYQLFQRQYKVSVISALPNYPQGKVFKAYKNKLRVKEKYKSIPVTRLFIFASHSTHKFIRLLSILSYALVLFFYLLFKTTPKRYIVQCSPLFVGFFAVLAAKIKRKSVILNVSDLWPLAGLEMGILSQGFYYKLLEKMEMYIYTNADTIVGQSNEILKHIDKRLFDHSKPLFLYRNYPDFETSSISLNTNTKEFKFVYAGLIGIAQGIEGICENINFPEGTSFHIYGDGPLAQKVKQLCSKKKRIFFHGNLSRPLVHEKLKTYDASIIPLKNRIYGSVPSKIFEYAKLGLPILYFSDGEGADLVENFNLGITQRQINYTELQQKIEQISLGKLRMPSKEDVLKISQENFGIQRQFDEFEKKCLGQ